MMWYTCYNKKAAVPGYRCGEEDRRREKRGVATTLKDVAKLAKVSLTTASFALNGKPVNEKTRQRVLEAAEKLHYYVDVNGRNLSTKKTHNISFVILNETEEQDYTKQITYYYRMLKGIMDYAQKKEYSVKYEVVSWNQMRKSDYFERLVYGHSVDGVIVVPQYKYSCDFIQLFEEESFPYVIINPWFEIGREHKVQISNYMGGMFVADYLLRRHYQKIYMINGPRHHISASEIESGFIAILLERGIPFDVSQILYSDYTFEGGVSAMRSLLEHVRDQLFGGVVFCANDNMAAGAMTVLHEQGIRIPEDVSVMGYDGQEISEVVYPKLTTMYVDTLLTGERAARRLFGILEEDPERKFYREITVIPKITEGGTTK